MRYAASVFAEYIDSMRRDGSVRFYVRVRPSASRTVAVAVMDDASIKVDIAAPPEGGKANVALMKYLSKEFGTPNVRVVSGKTERIKLIEVKSEK